MKSWGVPYFESMNKFLYYHILHILGRHNKKFSICYKTNDKNDTKIMSILSTYSVFDKTC